MEHSLPWNFRSSGANVPRTFVPMKLLYHENEYVKNFRSKCPKTRPIKITYYGNIMAATIVLRLRALMCGRLMALPLLPAEHIPSAFRHLHDAMPSNVDDRLCRLVTYVDETWVSSRWWPASSWSAF